MSPQRRLVPLLAAGVWSPGYPEGSHALPNTGQLLRVNDDGTFTVVAPGLYQPTSLDLIGNTAYAVTHTGEIWKVDNAS